MLELLRIEVGMNNILVSGVFLIDHYDESVEIDTEQIIKNLNYLYKKFGYEKSFYGHLKKEIEKYNDIKKDEN